MGARASGQGRARVPEMPILETAGNSCICEGKGLTSQALALNFSSLMGYVLQLEQKLTLLFKLVFSVLYHKTRPNNKNKTIKPSRPTCGSHVSYRTAQAAVVVSISICAGQVPCGCSHGALRKGPATCGSPAGEHRKSPEAAPQPGALPALGLITFFVSNKSQMETVWFCFEKLLCHLAPNGSIHVTAKEKEEFLPLFPGDWLCFVAHMES